MATDLFTCRICSLQTATIDRANPELEHVQCLQCGSFSITASATTSWETSQPSPRQIANAAGWVRQRQGIRITTQEVGVLLDLKTPTVGERANLLLLAFAQEYPKIGAAFRVAGEGSRLTWWQGASSSVDKSEVSYLARTYLLNEVGWIQQGTITTDWLISPKGWHRIDELKRGESKSDIGFCAMWFNENTNVLWTNAIEPAILGAGYKPLRIDRHEHNNRIDDEILAMLRRSKFAVADFTGQRGGVYFEAGFALGLGLDVVWTCSAESLAEVHFDNRQYSFVTWKPDELEDFAKRLQNRIEATIGRGSFAN